MILLFLRYTGARLHELLSLTAGGYRKAKDPCQAYVLNKGSLGREEKLIRFTPAIEAALVRYIRSERAKYDPSGRKRLSDLSDTDPIFLTQRGTPYSREAFYFHWRHWYSALNQHHKRKMVPAVNTNVPDGSLEFTPHDIRHLRVTEWLTKINQQCAGNDQQKQSTVERLRTAITSLQEQHKPISARTIYEECGLAYASFRRNPEALLLYQQHSTFLKRERKRTRTTCPDTVSPRDPLLAYKKSDVVALLR